MDYDEVLGKIQAMILAKRFDRETRQEYKRLKTSLMSIVFEAQDGKCFYCEVPLEIDVHEAHDNRLTKEHRTPRCHGSSWTDSPVLTCFLCNNTKGHRTEEEFLYSGDFGDILSQRTAEGVYGNGHINQLTKAQQVLKEKPKNDDSEPD